MTGLIYNPQTGEPLFKQSKIKVSGHKVQHHGPVYISNSPNSYPPRGLSTKQGDLVAAPPEFFHCFKERLWSKLDRLPAPKKNKAGVVIEQDITVFKPNPIYDDEGNVDPEADWVTLEKALIAEDRKQYAMETGDASVMTHLIAENKILTEEVIRLSERVTILEGQIANLSDREPVVPIESKAKTSKLKARKIPRKKK